MVKAHQMHPAIQRVVSQAKHQWLQTQGAQIRESPRARISPESKVLKGSQREVYRRTCRVREGLDGDNIGHGLYCVGAVMGASQRGLGKPLG